MSLGKTIAVGAVEGVLDWQMEKLDAKKGLTKPFRNYTDISRAVIVVGGIVVPMFVKGAVIKEYGQRAMAGEVALLTKSVINAVTVMTKPAGSFAARRTYSRDLYAPQNNPQQIFTGPGTPIVQPQELSGRGSLN